MEVGRERERRILEGVACGITRDKWCGYKGEREREREKKKREGGRVERERVRERCRRKHGLFFFLSSADVLVSRCFHTNIV